MSRTRNRALVVGLPLGAVLIAFILIRMRPEPPRSPPPERVPAVELAAVGAGSGPLPVFGNGTVRPRAEVELASQVGGRVSWVSPTLVSGAPVRAGQVLLRIEESDFVNAVAQARAQVAQDSVAVLEAEEEARIAGEEYAQFRARQGGTAGAPSPLVLREPQLQAARAALARSTAQLSDAELALERTRVRAPFDGMVRSESVDVGSFVASGQSVAVVFSTDVVEVVVPLSDADAAVIPGLWGLRTGSGDGAVEAEVVVEFGAGRFAWAGWVDRAETALDEQSRTIDIVVRVANPFRPGRSIGGGSADADAPPLLVGQYAEVRIAGRDGDYRVVPRRALQPGDEVWAVADSTVRVVPVRVLQQAGDSVFVTGEFAPGEGVVVSGVSLATDGMKVRPSNPGW
ncbi:MAG: efflux RND transporter periplasmic adaptor subunit [Gemmatimonadetes bacterium]|nr:efflux RND transporter periplasmic adaptor subunit [Gemmatimonadota bacterium]